MAARPSEQYTVALQGFSTFERGANALRHLQAKQRRHRVAQLQLTLTPVAQKLKAIREGHQPL